MSRISYCRSSRAAPRIVLDFVSSNKLWGFSWQISPQPYCGVICDKLTAVPFAQFQLSEQPPFKCGEGRPVIRARELSAYYFRRVDLEPPDDERIERFDAIVSAIAFEHIVRFLFRLADAVVVFDFDDEVYAVGGLKKLLKSGYYAVGIEQPQFKQFFVGLVAQFTLLSRHSFERIVVKNNQNAVFCHLNVRFDAEVMLRRARKSGQAVFGDTVFIVEQSPVRDINIRQPFVVLSYHSRLPAFALVCAYRQLKII